MSVVCWCQYVQYSQEVTWYNVHYMLTCSNLIVSVMLMRTSDRFDVAKIID